MVCVPACSAGGVFGVLYSLEEVFLAVDAAGAGEAAVGQLHLAVGALEAGAVPVPVQHLQDELVQDVLVAAGALGDFWGGGDGEKSSVSPPAGCSVRARCFSFLHPGSLLSATCLPRREQGLKPLPSWHRRISFQNLSPHGRTSLPPLLAPAPPRGPCVPGFPPAGAAGSPAASQPLVADPRRWKGAGASRGSSRGGNPAGGPTRPRPPLQPPCCGRVRGGCVCSASHSHPASAYSRAAPTDQGSRVLLSLSTYPWFGINRRGCKSLQEIAW